MIIPWIDTCIMGIFLRIIIMGIFLRIIIMGIFFGDNHNGDIFWG